MVRKTFAALATLVIMTGCAMAAEQPDGDAPGARAFIPFADMNGSIDNWHGDGRDGIWVEGHNNQWYYAQFMTACQSLPFATTIGFVTDGTSRIDKFSSILVRDERCWFKTFEKSDGPPKAEKD